MVKFMLLFHLPSRMLVTKLKRSILVNEEAVFLVENQFCSVHYLLKVGSTAQPFFYHERGLTCIEIICHSLG
jgi:hypothetical protein